MFAVQAWFVERREIPSRELFQYHRAQTPPAPHTAQRRTSRRTCRFVVRATQIPFTRVRPGPHAAMTGVIMLSGSGIGAGDMACDGVMATKAKAATAINLVIIRSSHDCLTSEHADLGWEQLH